MENWKQIILNGEKWNYAVSDMGNVKNMKTGRLLKPLNNGIGYLQVCLCNKGKRVWVYVHRLVGQAFVHNPFDYNEINHLNEQKHDNRAENLCWCSHQENINYGSRTIRMLKTRRNNKMEVTKHMFSFIISTEEAIMTNLLLENIEIVASYQDMYDNEMLIVKLK